MGHGEEDYYTFGSGTDLPRMGDTIFFFGGTIDMKNGADNNAGERGDCGPLQRRRTVVSCSIPLLLFWNKALEHRPRHYYYPGSAPAVRPTKMIAIDHDLPGSRDDSDFDGKKVRCSPQSFCSNSCQDPRGETGGTLARDKMTR